MAVAFTRLSWWLWRGKHQERRISDISSLNSEPDAELKDVDIFKTPMGHGKNVASKSKRVRKNSTSFEERKAIRDYDAVIVPSDGGCSSESGSDNDSDWSIGWLEPHGPNFDSDNESDDSFAVLVPCYGHGEMKGGSKDKLKPALKVPDIYAAVCREQDYGTVAFFSTKRIEFNEI